MSSTLTDLALPFGLRQVVLTPMSGAEVLGTPVALPAGRTLSFSEAEDFEELRGDDKLITVRGTGPSVNWDLEGGGISLAAYKVLNGGVITEEGTTPSQTRKLAKGAYDSKPKFRIEGRAISDSGGDFHVIIYVARVTGDVNGELSDGGFWLTGCSGQGFPSRAAGTEDALYDFIQNETEDPITL